MKSTLLTSLLFCITLSATSQYREMFTEANILTEDRYYGLAIPIWRDLLREKPSANINYKLGSCYLNLGIDRDRALPFLVKASKNVAKVYDPFSSSFESAPTEVYYYLAKAYHINTELDSAEKYYNKFLSEASKKQYLRPSAEKGLEMCATARRLMSNPLDVDILNIGSPINSKFAEYTPIVAYDENTLYFTSRRLRVDSANSQSLDVSTGLYYEDMYVSYKGFGGNWLEPELLNINVADDHSSVVSMSPDGRKIYLYKIFNNNGNIYESDFELGTGWTTPALVGSNVNTDDNEYFATVTSDDQTLYFVSDRKGGFGGKDIWYCKKLPTGEWGKAINLGEPINTSFDEDAPYLHPDGKTMYFSSNGHESMGGYDIFYTQKQGDGTWSQPENVGYPINTTDDDHSYVGTPSGQRAYYSSKGADTKGSTDIYVVDYNLEDNNSYPEFDMSAFALIKGWIFPEAGKELPADLTINITDTETKNVVGYAKPVERNGSFVFIVGSGAKYSIDVILGGENVYTEIVDIPAGNKYYELAREIFIITKDNERMAVALDDRVLGKTIKWRLLNKNQKLLPIGTKIYYLDENNQKIDSGYVSKDGFFEHKKLAPDMKTILQPQLAMDITDLEIILIDEDGVTTKETLVAVDGIFYQKGQEPDKTLVNLENSDEIENKNEQQPKEPVVVKSKSKESDSKQRTNIISKPPMNGDGVFTVNFQPNSYVQVNKSEVMQAASYIKDHLDSGKPVKVQIIGSASKVPTGIPGGNPGLAERRAQTGKSALTNALNQKGIEINKLSTIDLTSTVSGPEFKPGSDPKSDIYTDHQYFMIKVN